MLIRRSLFSFTRPVSSLGCAGYENIHHVISDVLKTTGQRKWVSGWGQAWPGGLMPCACRAMAGTFFSASMLVGPHWVGVGERLTEGDLADQGRAPNRSKGRRVLISEPAGFFPAASVWVAVLLLVRPVRQGYPSPRSLG